MKKVLLKAPLLTQSGYGHHGRTVLRALQTRPDLFDIYIIPMTWGHTSWLPEASEERVWIDSNIKKTIEYMKAGGQFDMSLQVSIPPEWEKLAPINIGITAGIETDKVAPQWIEKGNLMDKIITISKHSVDSYKDTVYKAQDNQTGKQFDYRLVAPIEYVSYPVLKVEPAKIDLDLQTDFNFLAVAQMGPRKNLIATVRAFVEKFKDNENVGLVIKTNIAKNSKIDRINSHAQLKAMVDQFGERKCKVYIVHGRLTDQEMAALYTHPKIKALVSTTHGEGFGLPLFEAAYYGLPVLATDWSGHTDFLYKTIKQKNGNTKTKHMFGRITHTLRPIQKEAVWDGVLMQDSQWAYAEIGSVKMNMEEVYKDHGRFKKRAKELQNWISKEFSEKKQYAEYIEQINSVGSELDEEIDDLFAQMAV